MISNEDIMRAFSIFCSLVNTPGAKVMLELFREDGKYVARVGRSDGKNGYAGPSYSTEGDTEDQARMMMMQFLGDDFIKEAENTIEGITRHVAEAERLKHRFEWLRKMIHVIENQPKSDVAIEVNIEDHPWQREAQEGEKKN
jgi:hypothetical protein